MAERNLASLGTRATAQGRITNNRDAVLPTRRMTEAPELRNRLQMRDAFRADPEVDAVRRALGMVNDAVEGLSAVQNEEFIARERSNAGQASADAAMDRVDEEKMATSTAYRTAIAMSRARRKAAEVEMILKPEIAEFLSSRVDADPTKGEAPADLEDVNELIERRFRSLLLDEQGNPIDFGDPAANLEVYGALERMRPALLNAAQETIRAQEADRVIRGFADELELQAAKEGRIDVESFMGRLPPGVDRNKARAALLESAVNAAEQLEDPDLLVALADSRRADGTGSWTPQQEGQLRDAARRVEAIIERNRAERSQETLGELSVQLRMGKRLNPAEVAEMISTGRLRPQDAELAFSIQERIDDDAWEDLQRARTVSSWTQPSGGGMTTGGSAAAMQLRADIIGGNLTPGQAHRMAGELYAQGAINLKTYESLADEARKIPTNAKAVQNAGAAIYEQQLIRSFNRTARQRAGQPGYASVETFNLRRATAMQAFYSALRQGAEGPEAYARALMTLPNQNRDVVARAVRDVGAEANARSAADQK
ncbi:MAG: hypothetical protein ACK4TR_08880 [Phenylobacterium sp.]|uniref:hypothetical protein n=1 Tax=Phenylobacterium sp. TaxID=1871053 RepID=UPI0039193C9F